MDLIGPLLYFCGFILIAWAAFLALLDLRLPRTPSLKATIRRDLARPHSGTVPCLREVEHDLTGSVSVTHELGLSPLPAKQKEPDS